MIPAKTIILFFSQMRQNFDPDRKIHRRNDKWLFREHKAVPTVTHTKFPATVMILGVMSNERNAIRVNGVDHKEVLERLVMPWIKSVSKERTYKKTLRRLIRPRRSKNGC